MNFLWWVKLLGSGSNEVRLGGSVSSSTLDVRRWWVSILRLSRALDVLPIEPSPSIDSGMPRSSISSDGPTSYLVLLTDRAGTREKSSQMRLMTTGRWSADSLAAKTAQAVWMSITCKIDGEGWRWLHLLLGTCEAILTYRSFNKRYWVCTVKQNISFVWHWSMPFQIMHRNFVSSKAFFIWGWGKRSNIINVYEKLGLWHCRGKVRILPKLHIEPVAAAEPSFSRYWENPMSASHRACRVKNLSTDIENTYLCFP